MTLQQRLEDATEGTRELDASPGQISLLRDVRLKGAINALLFSPHRSFGPSLREAGLIDGVGDSTGISVIGYSVLSRADASLKAKASPDTGEGG